MEKDPLRSAAAEGDESMKKVIRPPRHTRMALKAFYEELRRQEEELLAAYNERIADEDDARRVELHVRRQEVRDQIVNHPYHKLYLESVRKKGKAA